MSVLLDRTGRSASTEPESGWVVSPLAAGALAAVRAVAASLVLALLPVVLAWVSVPNGSGWFDAVRVGLAVWLLAHHGSLAVSGGAVGLVPLGFAVVPAVACWLAARRLARSLDPKGAAIDAGVSRARPARIPAPAFGGFVGCYLALTAVVALAAGSGQVRPVTGQALLGALLLSTVFGGWGAAAYRAGSLTGGLWLLLRRVPEPVLRGVRLGLVAVWVLLGGATVLLGVAVAVRLPQVLEVHRALAPGAGGTVALLVLQAAYLPNLVIWTGSFAAGPGFAFGVATSVTSQQTVLGPLPAVPVLGALPAPGAEPRALALAVLLPVLAGAVAGTLAASRRPRVGLTALAADGAIAAVAAGAVVLLLAWLSGGPVGPGRLAVVGPVPWLTGAVVAAEVLIGAWLGTALWRGSAVLVRDR